MPVVNRVFKAMQPRYHRLPSQRKHEVRDINVIFSAALQERYSIKLCLSEAI